MKTLPSSLPASRLSLVTKESRNILRAVLVSSLLMKRIIASAERIRRSSITLQRRKYSASQQRRIVPIMRLLLISMSASPLNTTFHKQSVNTTSPISSSKPFPFTSISQTSMLRQETFKWGNSVMLWNRIWNASQMSWLPSARGGALLFFYHLSVSHKLFPIC